ncbi:hypothetical protein [Deinococcus sonorensis]|uniref:Uncharacterized protein n=1 Tax=Deinococcus sonorensis TaxID=309891 RepID=A0ABV8Y8F0_9DEIO
MDKSTAELNSDARQALRDILFLYADLAGSYGGVGHGADTGTFDPHQFLDVDLEQCPDLDRTLDLALLRQGSAIALLCGVYDLWNEAEDVRLDDPWVDRLRAALAQGSFRCCPDIEHVILETFESHFRYDDPWLHQQAQPLYERYVRAYFARLAIHQPLG